MQVIQLAMLHPITKQQRLEQVKTKIKTSIYVECEEAQGHTQPAETDPGMAEKHRQQCADIPPVVAAFDVARLIGFLCLNSCQQVTGSVGSVDRAGSDREAQ